MKESPPVSPKDTEVSCQTCVAACCRAGSGIILSETEVSVHKRQMGPLKAVLRPKKYPQQHQQDIEGISNGKPARVLVSLEVPQYHGFYIMLTDCGNIDPDSRYGCKDYDNRPNACRVYEVGSEACKAARATYGLDGHTGTVGPEIRTEPIKVSVPRYQTY